MQGNSFKYTIEVEKDIQDVFHVAMHFNNTLKFYRWRKELQDSTSQKNAVAMIVSQGSKKIVKKEKFIKKNVVTQGVRRSARLALKNLEKNKIEEKEENH